MPGLKNKKILVTGGAGFIGSHLIDQLVDEQPKAIYIVDNLFLGNENNLAEARHRYPNIHFYKMDATNSHALRQIICQNKIEIVFDLATKALGYSFDNPTDAFHVNVQIVGNLLESLRLGEIQRLIHFSSSEAYGTAQFIPMKENHPLLPCTPYAAGKASADLFIQSYQKTFGLDVLIIRPFNNYGPRQNKGLYAGVIPITIERLLKGQPPIIYGDGLQTRDFIYVEDTVRLTIALAKKDNLAGQIINIGSGKETSIKEIIEKLTSVADYKGHFEKAPTRPGDVRRHCADITSLQSIIGNLSLRTFEDGLTQTFKWYTQFSKK